MSADLEEHLILFMVVAVQLASLPENVFIVAADFLDYIRGRTLKACDRIQCSLAVSRVGYQCSILFHDFAPLFPSGGKIHNFTLFTNRMFFYTSMWIAALLSALYFLTIANKKNAYILLLKRLISQKVHYFLVSVFLVALCFSYQQISDMFVGDDANNLTYANESMDDECEIGGANRFSLVFLIGNSGPFVIYGSFFFFLLISKCRNMKQMRSRDTGLASKHLDAYYAAIKSIAAGFLLFTVQFVTNIVYMILDDTTYTTWIEMLLVIFPSLHSAYLVYRNPKLRQQFYLLCLRVRNFRSERGMTTSNISQNP